MKKTTSALTEVICICKRVIFGISTVRDQKGFRRAFLCPRKAAF